MSFTEEAKGARPQRTRTAPSQVHQMHLSETKHLEPSVERRVQMVTVWCTNAIYILHHFNVDPINFIVYQYTRMSNNQLQCLSQRNANVNNILLFLVTLKT